MSGKPKRRQSAAGGGRADSDAAPSLRIVGGKFRGTKLPYSGDQRTRPMKDRVREAVFNLLGPGVVGTHAIDLFAGTGALGLEAISRGAVRATFIERHFPTADGIRESLARLELENIAQVAAADAFLYFRGEPDLGAGPWTVFCSPPYEFYASHGAELLELIAGLVGRAPAESHFVVEADQRFDFSLLPHAAHWRRRSYPPAEVGILSR